MRFKSPIPIDVDSEAVVITNARTFGVFVFENINKEHIINAIEKIDLEGRGVHPDSRYYDVLFEEKRYPPKPIMAIPSPSPVIVLPAMAATSMSEISQVAVSVTSTELPSGYVAMTFTGTIT